MNSLLLILTMMPVGLSNYAALPASGKEANQVFQSITPLDALWPSLGGSPYRRGLSLLTGPKSPGVGWHWETSDAVFSSATVDDRGHIYIASRDGELYALDAEGRALWISDTGSSLTSSPSIGPDGTLLVGATDGTLLAIGNSGEILWRKSIDGPIHAAPCISELGMIYVGTMHGSLYGIGLDGSEAWQWTKTHTRFEFPDCYMAAPTMGLDGRVYAGTLYDPNLYALNAMTGEVDWQREFLNAQGIFAAPVVSADGTIYQVFLGDDSIYAIEPSDGSLSWQLSLSVEAEQETFDAPPPAGWAEPVLGQDGTIYTCMDDPTLRAISPEGDLLWSLALGHAGGFTLTVDATGTVYAAGSDGTLYTINPERDVHTFEIGKSVSYPIITPNNRLIVTSPAENKTVDLQPSLWVLSDPNQ